MLKLYNANNVFARMIPYYSNLEIVSELVNGDKTLSFTLKGCPSDVKTECYIEYADESYVIKEINYNDGDTDFVCKLNLEMLERDMIPKFTASNLTVDQMCSVILNGTGWTSECSMTKKRSVQQYNKTPYELLLKVRDAFMCEIRFDTKTKTVLFASDIGQNKGSYFRKDLNLKSLNLNVDSYDFYTRIIPYGKDGLDIKAVNGGKDYVENFQYSNKIKTLVWEDSSYEDANSLKADAEAKLASMSIPKKRYACKIIDLANASSGYGILAYGLGDTIDIIDGDKELHDSQKIVKITEHPAKPSDNTVELANTFLSWEEMQDRLQAAADAWDALTNSDGTVNGIYVHGITNGEGRTEIEVLINGNKTVLDASQKSLYAVGVANNASTTASSALSAANAAAAAAAAAQTAAGTAQTAANGKNTVFYQDSAPSGAHKVGDTWFDTGDGNKLYGWNGSAWDAKLFGGDAIAHLAITNAHISNLDAGKITAGVLIGREINNGNGTFRVTSSGVLTASIGTIAGWNLSADSINSTTGSGTANQKTVFLANGTNSSGDFLVVRTGAGTDASPYAYPFVVHADGAMTATKGTIAGWNIQSDRLFSHNKATNPTASDTNTRYYAGFGKSGNTTQGGYAFCIYRNDWDATSKTAKGSYPFYVTYAGLLKATNVDIKGKITATSGNIAGWILQSDRLYSQNKNAPTASDTGTRYSAHLLKYVDSSSNGAFLISVAEWKNNSVAYSYPFRVNYDGSLTATKATITGTINSTNGSIGGFTIGSTSLKSKYLEIENANSADGSTITMYKDTSYSRILILSPSAISLTNGAGSTGVKMWYDGTAEISGDTRIDGDVKIGGMTTWNSSSYGVFIDNDGQINIRRSNGGTVRFWRGTDTTNYVNLKCLDSAAGAIRTISLPNAAGTIALASSDVRIKTNIKNHEVENAFDVIDQIKLHSFDWTDGRYENPHQKIGFIADELEEIDPRFKLEGTGGYDSEGEMNIKCIDEFYLLGYMVKALQEANARIKELEARTA